MRTPKKGRKEKSFYIKTFGCQMNYHDTERMSALMVEQGYTEARSAESADTVIFNTCSIRDKAHHKGVSGLGHFRRVKRENPKIKLGFAGCVAQHDGERVLKSFPFLNFVLGTDNIDVLPEILYRVDQGESPVMAVGFDPSQDYSIETKIIPGKKQAFVNIMKGCDNFCTYCIVPFTRGREKSRRVEEVVADVENLLKQGVNEVMLLGQNVNSYGKSLGGKKAGQTFARLLRELEAMADRLDADGITDPEGKKSKEGKGGKESKPKGLLRLRYTTSNPKDFDESMMEAHRDLRRLVPHLHLPVQSGSPDVLRKMKRYQPIQTYIEKVLRLRELVPGIAISSDMIVGFPTETEADFEMTMDLIEKIRFEGIYAYAYSERPGTKAVELGDTVPEETKKARLHMLQHRQGQIQAEDNCRYQGQVVEVLVEGNSKMDPNILSGRTPHWKIVNFSYGDSISEPNKMISEIAPVKITQTSAFALRGELIEGSK